MTLIQASYILISVCLVIVPLLSHTFHMVLKAVLDCNIRWVTSDLLLSFDPSVYVLNFGLVLLLRVI